MSSPSRHRSRRVRLVSRWAALFAALIVSVLWRPWEPPLAALSPFVGIASALAVRRIGFVACLCLPVLLLVVWRPMGFCRYLCPVGFAQELLGKLRPPGNTRWRGWPRVGRILALAALGGAALGYPLFLWLDPLALFSAFFSAPGQGWTRDSLWAAALFPLVLVFDLLLPHVWCRRVCPLGAAQEMLLVCRAPRRAVLPALQTAGPTFVLRRRGFFAVCFGAVGAWAIRKTSGTEAPLRPPGALPEERFTGVCIRCGNCMRVCPSRILKPDIEPQRWLSLGAPVAHFEDGYCKEDCNRCGMACPSGAIGRLALAEKRACAIGGITFNLNTCELAAGRDCTACIRACPYDALKVFSDGFDTRPEVTPSRCTGCGACEAACPVRPERAVRVFSAVRRS